MQHFDVIVVGGGVMGCATAASLAGRGAKVLLCEAERIGTLNGSSHGKSRIIRLAYGAPDYIALCRAAYAAWHALEDEAAELLLYTTGGVDIAPPGIATWDNARTAMTAAGVSFDVLDTAEMHRRFPQFHLADGVMALYQADAGVLHADRCVAALADAARRRGADLREGCRVAAIKLAPGGIAVVAGGETLGADRLVLAGGAQINALLAMIGASLPLTVSLEEVAYFRPRESAPFVAGRFPLFIRHFHDGRLSSGFPLIRDPGLKLMLEHKSEAETPGRLDALRAIACDLVPGLTGEIFGTATCRYTLTPDEDFVLDRWSGDPRVVIASACSGHGFKFGALFGAALADLALGTNPAIDLSRFGMTRFREPALAMVQR